MGSRTIFRSAIAGLAYCAAVFAAGFALGALRVALLTPAFGETFAVMLELPVMLTVSWVASSWIVAWRDVPAKVADRLVMGGAAFAVLMVAEIGVSVFVFGRSLSEHLTHYRELPALLGLAGQIAFASFPLIQCMDFANPRCQP